MCQPQELKWQAEWWNGSILGPYPRGWGSTPSLLGVNSLGQQSSMFSLSFLSILTFLQMTNCLSKVKCLPSNAKVDTISSQATDANIVGVPACDSTLVSVKLLWVSGHSSELMFKILGGNWKKSVERSSLQSASLWNLWAGSWQYLRPLCDPLCLSR